MGMQASDASDLQLQIRWQTQTLQQENEELRRQLAAAQARLAALQEAVPLGSLSQTKDAASHPGWAGSQHNLSSSQISRYSRHLLLPSFGVAGRSIVLRPCAALALTSSFHSLHCTCCRPGAPVQRFCPRHWSRRPGFTCCSVSGRCRYALSVPFLSWQSSEI